MQKSVLVVEDNRDVQEVLCMILEDQGYEVVAAANGAQALEKMQTIHPSVVLLDYMMPVMNGATFMHELQQRGLRQDLHVVLITASGAARRLGREMGADVALDKPFDLDRLLDVVASWNT
jgi:CheY-like chemotaxis protein